MWTKDVESIVYTRIKSIVGKKLKTKYPDLYFTNSDKVPTDPKFPTVYIHELSGTENARDLEGNEVNSTITSFQIEVTENDSQSVAKDVMYEVIKVFKDMKFSVIMMPEFQNMGGYIRCVSRCRRTIGKSDIL